MGESAQDQGDSGETFRYLSQREVRFLDAAVARLIPADDLGPGAKEAGVTIFIDRQLDTAYGSFARAYRQGPFAEGTPQQGFQSPLTPKEIYRESIREIDAYCTKQHGKTFANLAATEQDALLKQLESGKFEMQCVGSKTFFDLLLKNTFEGFFSDPIHGGNKDKVGWRLIGFPGVASSSYPKLMQLHNQPYKVHPVSILDITQKGAKVDAQGYAVHPPIKD